MAFTTIDNPELYFQTKLYLADASDPTSITFDGSENMQPDMLWFKARDEGYDNVIYDSVRGVQKDIRPNAATAETTHTTAVSSFNADGFSIAAQESRINENTTNYVVYGWKANGSGASNTAGSLNTTKTSANTTSGVSIITYTGNGSAGATIGHGMGITPQFFVQKRLAGSGGMDWHCYHTGNGSNPQNSYLYLNTNAVTQETDSASWFLNDTYPSSSLITLGNATGSNGDTINYVIYAFAPVQAFSRISTFVGNGSNDGPFLYCGFKPAWFMSKRIDSAASWNIWNNKSNPHNVADALHYADGTDAEASSASYSIDFLSNGIKMRGYRADTNTSGATHVWMAFAEAPLVNSNGVPCNAR